MARPRASLLCRHKSPVLEASFLCSSRSLSSIPRGSVGRAAWTECSGGASGDGLLADASAAEGPERWGGAHRAPGSLQGHSGHPADSPEAGTPTSPSCGHCDVSDDRRPQRCDSSRAGAGRGSGLEFGSTCHVNLMQTACPALTRLWGLGRLELKVTAPHTHRGR